jgi:sugar/nucleoside kinase (ribokinase family)
VSAPSLLVVGNVNVDLVMGEVDSWPAVGTEIILPHSEMRPGGSAGNTALALDGLGIDHMLVATVGDDAIGNWLMNSFDAKRSVWATIPGATTITVGVVHKGGDRAFFTSQGHLHRSRTHDFGDRIPRAPAEGGYAILSGGYLMPTVEAGTSEMIKLLKSLGWRTAIDPGWPPKGWTEKVRKQATQWYEKADIVLLNLDEVVGVTGETDVAVAVSSLRAQLLDDHILVVKRGQAGASAYCDGASYHVRAPSVEVVDTVGAGDTFNAAFLAHLSEGGDLSSALTRGVMVASRAISTFPRRYR